MQKRLRFQVRSALSVIPVDEIRRFIKFAAVGLSGTLLDFATFSLLIGTFNLPTLVANTISYSAGIVNNFALNHFWTFSGQRNGRLKVQFLQFAGISLIGLLLNNLIVAQAEALLSGWKGVNLHLIAKAIATGIVVFWNFTANRLWTYANVKVEQVKQG